ncbi:AhpC/TSA antioxidant enzyme-domain-containing protein [Aspergillus ambiguus]|uniref:peroxiredoxin-like family protein n=1 Tax=Aspergillus ambiguus TaxID=176160 RepID=UPI003CCE3060
MANSEPPSPETLAALANHPILDCHSNPHAFQDLYASPSSANRTLVIFIRHFFCGSCQEYVRALSRTLSQPPPNTSIVIIGCGDPALIDMYAADTTCPFPIYADPSRTLYEALGMVNTLALGARPEYIRKGMLQIVVESVWQALKQVPSGLAMKGGDSRQVGGEFLFERNGDGGHVVWCHRMATTRDHTEVEQLARLLQGGEGEAAA